MSHDNSSQGNCRLPQNEATISALTIMKDQDLRIPCYCEENVYRLVYRKLVVPTLTPSPSNQYFVIFVSSESQCVPMFHQLAQKSSTYPCFWDYHVLALEITKDGEPFILDIDSTLPYPSHLTNYLENVFPNQNLPQSYRPLFRIVPADSFLLHFSSDRRHMRRDDGTFSAPPPKYNCIYVENEGSFNLDSYRFMKESDASHFEGTIFGNKYGSVFTMDQLKMIDWNDIHSSHTTQT